MEKDGVDSATARPVRAPFEPRSSTLGPSTSRRFRIDIRDADTVSDAQVCLFLLDK